MNFGRRRMFALAGAAIIVVAVGGIAYAKTRAPNYQSAIVGRGDIADEVLASGNVESPGAATLHFKTTGKLAALNVSAGDAVEAGEVLASLDTGTLQAAYDEAAANLAAAKSALSKLQAGATDEDVAVVSAAKESADVSASNAADTLANADTAALQNLRSALSSKVDQLFTDPETNPGFGITISSGNTRYLIKAGDTAEQSLINRLRRQVGDELYALSASINEEEDLGMRSQKAQAAADDTATLLSHIADAMGDYTGTDTDGQAVYQGYKADIASARTSVESTRSALIGAISAYESASASVAQAQKSLLQTTAPARSEDVASAEASVDAADARLAAARAALADAQILAPTSGIVAHTDGTVGEVVGPEAAIVSLIPNVALDVKVNVSEDNVVGVQPGNPVRIELDAFPAGTAFGGRVFEVEPGETVIGGAIYYKATILFDSEYQGLRPGMTANVWITTASSTNALLVPASAIVRDGANASVRVLSGGKAVPRDVTLGIEGQNGMVEVTDGLSDGEKVVIGQR